MCYELRVILDAGRVEHFEICNIPFFQVLSFPMRYAGLVEISRIFMLDIEIIQVPNS